jgi:hypothetical protein
VAQPVGEEGGEKRRSERQDAQPVGRGALGEEQEPVARMEPRLEERRLFRCLSLSRRTKTVPVPRASQPIPAQPATSALATKYIRFDAFRTRMSSQLE